MESVRENLRADALFLVIRPLEWLKEYDGRTGDPLGISPVIDAFRADPYLAVDCLPEVFHGSDLVSMRIEGTRLHTATLEEQQSNTDCVRVRALNISGEHLSRLHLIIVYCHGVAHLLLWLRKDSGIGV